ncbi:MAG: hypothetical protein HYZ29_21940 [Myxococcales bacterium]|nr:hypothetical protein [Myxococcales bacterium]
MNPNEPTFREAHRVEKQGIVGAKWWQEGLAEQTAVAVPRRTALAGMVGLATVIGGIAVIGSALAICGAAAAGDSEVEFKTVDQASLTIQRQYGWNFGAVIESLVFDGEQKTPFDRAAFGRLRNELMPVKGELRPFYWPTLFEAPTAMPKTPIEGESPTTPLSEALKPVFTTAMDVAYKRGKALANLFAKATADTAVLVDLPGPESVAMAAGMAERFEPISTFDNWPHPRGVVPAHMTLAAAAYYQPLFAKMQQRRTLGALPLFVLDRKRLSQYTDETRQFDNRYVAKLPPPDAVKKLGVKRLLYVVPGGAETTELDDLNQDFVDYEKAGIDVKMVAATDFTTGVPKVTPDEQKKLEEAGDWPPYLYGGDDASAEGFWSDYGWDAGTTAPVPAKKLAPNRHASAHKSWAPTARATAFGSSTTAPSANADGTGSMSKSAKVAMGVTAVAVAAGTGVVLGTRYGTGRTSGPRSGGRSGSFGRSTGSGSS